jgi:hypothetical protein
VMSSRTGELGRGGRASKESTRLNGNTRASTISLDYTWVHERGHDTTYEKLVWRMKYRLLWNSDRISNRFLLVSYRIPNPD